jgi:hypothetical protein
MKRFTHVIRTRSRSSEDRQRDAFQKQLLRDGQKLLEKLSRQFADDLNAQLAQVLSGSARISRSGGAGSTSDTAGIVGGISQLLSTTVRYLVSRPRTSSNTTESSRSQEVEERFRLSQSQAAAEASSSIYRGNKNL